MDPVSETPTKPADYALLSGTYSSLLTISALTANRRGTVPVRKDEMIPLAAATFALSKLLVHEKVETWVRQPFVEENAAGKRPKGYGLRYAVGELLTCTRCAGAWSALALVSLRLHAPATASTVTAVLTVSACNDFLHSGFSWLNAYSNHTQYEAEIAEADRDQRAHSESSSQDEHGRDEGAPSPQQVERHRLAGSDVGSPELSFPRPVA